jgi:hypothetical protein
MRRRRKFYLAGGIVAMSDLLHRVWNMVTDGARPIDWIIVAVDFLVLVAILWLEFPEWLHKRKVQRRKRKLFECWATGQTLQTSVPVRYGPENMASWLLSFRNWNNETHILLRNYSPEAAIAFFHETTRDAPPDSYHDVADQARESYRRLLIRLNNLKTIMENADGYL